MSREALIMLPGMMCDERLFAPQIAAFSRRYDCAVPTLSQPTITEMAHHVLSVTKAPVFNLAGLSMGGIVAMEIVRHAPERVLRLALLDTNHHGDSPERYAIRNRQIEDARIGKLRDVIIDEMKPIYLAKANRNNQTLLNLLIDMAMDCGVDAFVAQSTALRDRADMTDVVASYSGPALVLFGDEDYLCPADLHEEMASLLTHSETISIAKAGHISTLENPEAVNDAFERWLAHPSRKD